MGENFEVNLGGVGARQAHRRGQRWSFARWHGGAREWRGARAGAVELAARRLAVEAGARRGLCGGELWRRRRRRQGLGLGHGERTRRHGYMRVSNATEKETEKSPENAGDPLTGRSGGSNRMLPPSVRSIPERSNSSGIGTERVRWSMTGCRQGPVNSSFVFFTRPEAERLLTGR